MNDKYLDDTIETSTEETAPKGNLTTKQYKEVAESAERNRQSELRSLSQTLGTIARQDENAALTRQALHVDTLDNVIRTTKNINVDEEGKLQFPEIPMPDGLTKDEEKAYSVLQNQARESMQYVLDKYNEDRQSVGGDVHYIAGSALRSAADLLAGSIALAPQIAGMVIHAVGTMGDDKENWAVRNGTLLQEYTANGLDLVHQTLTKALFLDPAQTSETAKELSKLVDVGAQVAGIAKAAVSAGAKASAKALGIAIDRNVSKEVAERYAKQWANKASAKVAKRASGIYIAAQTEDYILRPRQGKTSEEYLEYLRAKTGGEILSDLAWAGVVGLSNYYLEKAFGAEAAIQNFFGDAASGLVKLAIRRAGEEGLTEIAQDQVLNVADLIRGRMSVGEFASNLISPETLETFVISAIIGGATATGEYATTRMKLVKEYKTNLKKAFPDATEKQLETAGQAFINSVEDNVVGKVHQSIIADDQLKNGYGTYNKIVQNRINKLINDSIAQGKELAFKDKSPEYQAQFVGSASQQFVDELYAQAVLRGVPVNEVFDVTKMDVENGILYMYGKEYGKRPLTQFTKDMTPAQWEQAQLEKRAAEELQRKTKEEQAQVQKALKEAQKQEKAEEKRKVSYEASLPYREYLAGRGFQESELDDKQAVQQARTMAKNEIRTMPEDNARGVLATLRDDLPVESMTATEIRQILRSELQNFMALQNKNLIEPIAKAPSIEKRQAQIVRRVRMAKPKSFSEFVKSAGISKDTVEKLGLAGELKKILDKNYRFFVRKNGTISNFEELAMEYKYNDMYDPNNPQQATVNDFLELLERDLQTKDIYSYQDENALKEWQERSIRAGKEEESRLLAERDQELADSIGRLQETGYDTSTMTDDAILAKGREMRAEEAARMDMIDSDIDFDAIPDDDWLHSIKEQTDLADENARLDDIYPEYKGETIDIFDYDTTSVSDWADKNIEKQDSFETDEGVFTNYKLLGDNRNMPTFTVFESKDGWIVRNAYIPESEQNKGIGTKFYQYINLKSIEKTGKPLRSTQPRKLSSGKEVFELSDLGHKLWDSLTKKGLAVKNKNGTYEFKKPQERTVYNSNGERIAKSEPALRNFWNWFGDSYAVDEDGRPLVVYHGTDAEFDTFDIEKSNNGVYGKGFYFGYTRRIPEAHGKIVLPVYLKIEKPLMVSSKATVKEIREKIKSTDVDGYFSSDEVFVKNNTQIKSTQNRGTFSPDTGNIYYQKRLAAWNPLRRSIELFTGANETSIMHELSHFWLDNMMLYSRLESAARDSGFAKVWNNIKKYLNIDDRQERINESQAEKYTSAYMQYIRNTKIAPVVDLGFKGMDEFIGDISLDYFENAKHREADGTTTSELEIITPEMVDTFQKLTTTDLNAVRDLVVSLQDREFTDGAIDSQLGEESTPEQMKTAVTKQERETRQKIAEKSTQNAERDSMPTDIPQDSKTMQNAQNRLDKEKSTYEVGTTDEESFAKAREIIAKDRARAEEIVAIDPNGITDGIANSFVALELARQAVANGKNAMPYLESFANGISGSGANLRTANLLNTPEFAWAKDMYEASKAKNYAIALRMRPAARNAILHRSRIAQTFESKLDQYVEELYPQLLQAQTYEEQVKIINEWANNTAKKIGVEPTSEVWGQSVKGTSAKKTEFSKEVVYQKRKLKEFLKSKIGATLTDAEQLKIRQLHTNTIDAMRQLQTNPNDIETAKEFIRKAREYQDYLNALVPVNWANALFSSIPRASMLFRISTQVKNTVGTRLEILLSDLNRQLRYGKDNLISKKDRDAEIKKSMEMFLIGGFSPDVQENFFETPILAWGEEQYTMIQRGGERRGAVFSKERLAQDKADIANYISDNWKSGDGAGKKALVAGRIGIAVAEKMTGKAYDVLAYSDAYMKAIIATHETAKAATFYAQTIGKEKGWTKEQIKEYAEMLFKDARSYIPKTKLGVAIRKQAVEQAKIETFIKNGTISTFANSVRKGINLGKESGIGTFISPYVSTAANIMQIGIDYTTGWWRRFDGWNDVKNRVYENAKKGEPIDQKDMEYLEKGYRGTYGGLFLLTMLALFKGAQALTGEDDTLDYVPPYSQLTPRERAYYKQVNGGKYNAVKIGDIWVSAEYFGGLSNAITNLGTWYHANSIISAAKGMIAETPVIGDLVEQHDKLQQDITYDKGVIDIAMASVLNQAEKYIPGIGKDIYKAIDEERFLYPLVGGSVGLTVSDEAKTVLDVQRESKATYTSISRSKPFNKLSKEDKRKLDDEFNKEYIAFEANKWIQRNPNATPEQQKKALDAIRKKIREKLKRKYKVK